MQPRSVQSEALSTQTNQPEEPTLDSPMQIRLINFLGLKNYLMDKFIFRRKSSSYKIRKQHGVLKLFTPRQYKPPVRYEMQVGILQHENHSIPFVKLVPRKIKEEYFDTIVYAHGNSSDMSDGLRFMERMALIHEAEYIIFDYNGYGQSRNIEVGEDIISRDIEIVLAWISKPLNQIILWGFSLGSYPVLSVAAKYFVKGVILQCPIASVGCFFKDKLTPQIKFKQDYFANINLISSVKGKIFMIHSHFDEVIPIAHVQLLYDKYVTVNGSENMFFVEVMKLPHNGIHKYIVSQKKNDLQKQLLTFLDELKSNEVFGFKDIPERLSNINNKTRLSHVEEQDFNEDCYELTDGSKKNFGVKSKANNINCFCFPSEVNHQSSRQKFRSN